MRIDTKLARGLALAEIRDIVKATQQVHVLPLRDPAHPIHKVMKPLLYRYATGRRPDKAFVDRVTRLVDDIYEGQAGTIYSFKSDPEPDKLPKFERTYIHLGATGPTTYPMIAIKSASVGMAKGYIMISEMKIAEIGLHALERYHMRTRLDLDRSALRNFGNSMSKRMGLIEMISQHCEDLAGLRAPIPLADGLALGSFLPAARRDAFYIQAQPFEARIPNWLAQELAEDDEPDDRDDKLDEMMDTFRHTYRIQTFIGPREMRPDQIALREALLDFERTHEKELAFRSLVLVAPFDAAEKMQADDTRGFGVISGRALEALLTDPAHVRAMANVAPGDDPIRTPDM